MLKNFNLLIYTYIRHQLNTTISDIRVIRENYGTIVDKAKKLCESWSILFYKNLNGLVNYFPEKLIVIDNY